LNLLSTGKYGDGKEDSFQKVVIGKRSQIELREKMFKIQTLKPVVNF